MPPLFPPRQAAPAPRPRYSILAGAPHGGRRGQIVFFSPSWLRRPLEAAGRGAQGRARKEASGETAREAGEDARPPAGPDAPADSAGNDDDPSRRKRRELEAAYVDEMMADPARAAGQPTIREFFMARARTLPDDVLAAHCNLAGGKDYDDNSAMLRDLDLVMQDAMKILGKRPE